MARVPHDIEVPRVEIETFCVRTRARKLSFFGSILTLTERTRPDSDVDVVVEFEPDAAVTYLDLARIEREQPQVVAGKWTCAHRKS